jgi:glycine reductase
MGKYRIVHYINQFFGGIGGEEKAGTPPQKQDGFTGPGQGLSAAIGDSAEIVGTVICGDDYFNENEEAASSAVLDMIKSFNPDLVIVGPAFNAGRYGMACGMVAKLVDENLSIPVVGGIYVENPGFEMYRRYAYFVETTNAATGMRQAVPAMAALIKRLAAGETVEDGFMPKGVRKNVFRCERGARRAVNMLLKKLKGDEFVTEYPMPVFDRVAPGKAVADIKKS